MTKKSILAAAMGGVLLGLQSMAAETSHSKASESNTSTTAFAPASDSTGECWGVNSCKGKGECGGPGLSCAGTNSCKGKGWVSLTKKECEKKKGKFKANPS